MQKSSGVHVQRNFTRTVQLHIIVRATAPLNKCFKCWPSSFSPRFQSESWCSTTGIQMEMTFFFIFIKLLFIWIVEYQELLSNRGKQQLGDGLLFSLSFRHNHFNVLMRTHLKVSLFLLPWFKVHWSTALTVSRSCYKVRLCRQRSIGRESRDSVSSYSSSICQLKGDLL